MTITNRIAQFIKEKSLLNPNDKVLLAVSGGKDSMLMMRVFYELEIPCIVAHCNFKLRGEDSDMDEELVRSYAQQLGLPFYIKHFNTSQEAEEKGMSIQMVARELRYAWFEELSKEQSCQKIAIAQHQNDHIETALLNLTRSTGLQGLLGISVKRGKIIRPLLGISAAEVLQAVQQMEIPYRDDQSNFSTKYARNKIRLEIIPKFKEIQENFESIMLQNMTHFEESMLFIQRHVGELRSNLFKYEEEQVNISCQEIKEYIDDSYLLFELFKPYGFQKNILKELQEVFNKPMGQIFESPTHLLLLNRDQLIIKERSHANREGYIIPDLLHPISIGNASLSFDFTMDFNKKLSKEYTQIDFDSLRFPLQLRYWKEGDVFYPLGMKGKKKLSDYFIQQKINRFQKEAIPLLCNANGDIIWVVGHRLDNRFKVTENTKKVLTLVFN